MPRPRLPWRYPKRRKGRIATECNGRVVKVWDHWPTAQEVTAATAKLCGPRKLARQFDDGGPESGTFYGARRAPGLFDSNWGNPFPLTRKEQKALQEGEKVTDPFFAPPTTPAPENWIEDKLKRIRGTFAPTQYLTPKSYLPFCREGGYVISCVGPNGGVGWYGGNRPLTPLEVEQFREAYCKQGECITFGSVPPPPGFKVFNTRTTPRNPAVRLKASCQPPIVAPQVVMDFPPPPAPEVPPAPASPPGVYTIGCPPGQGLYITTTGLRCLEFSIGTIPATREDLIRFGIPVT